MSDPILVNLTWGVAGNLATNVVQHFGDNFNDTKIGRGLTKVGLLKPNINQIISSHLKDAVSDF